MMRVKIILFALVLVLFGCSHRTAVILDDVETYIQERPDSALATLRAIDTTTLTTKKLQAHYALLHAMALDKNWIDTTDVNVVMPAVRYYDRHPSGDRRAKAWYYLGRIQQNGMDYPAASISLLKAERYAEASIDTSFKVILYLSMGTLYGQSHFPEEALCYSEKAYSLSQATGDTMNANASLFAMAIDLHNVGRYAESDSLYRLLINSDLLDFHLRPTLLCNYALSCVTQKEDYEQAVRLFEEVIGSIGALPKRNYWGAYAYSLERIGKKDQADRLFRKLETKNKDIALSYAHWKSLADAYSEDYPSAYQMLQDAYSIQNDNVKKAFRQSAIKAQKDFLEEMSQESETTARRRLFWAGSAIVGLIIILILIVFFFIRRSRKFAQEKESILEAYNALTSQAEEEKAMVRNQYIHLFKSHFGHLGRMNELLNTFDRNSNDNLYLELKKTIQRIGQDEKSQQLFENMLDDSFDGLMTHFRESFPGKKRRYYQLVSYLFAGFGTATIVSIIPSYNPHNVHVEKSRLKQMIRASDSPYKALFLRLL